jgi:hypothetical protein
MDTIGIAVINESKHLDHTAIAKAAAAVQMQVTADLFPVWGVSATVADFPSLTAMPVGFWPVVIRDVLATSDTGVHLTDTGDKPFALVAFTGKNWTIALSHEILEMLVDPIGTGFQFGPSPKDDQGTVSFVKEICDPCQADDFAYHRNDDQRVSDFVTPTFYTGFGTGSYSFRGKIKEPRTVLAGGYITWQDPLTHEWWQMFDDGDGPDFRQPDPAEFRPDVHLRGAVDREAVAARGKRSKRGRRKPRATQAEKRLQQHAERAAAAMAAQAEWWRKQIERVAPSSDD